MKISTAATTLIQAFLFLSLGMPAWAADNEACVGMAASFFSPTGAEVDPYASNRDFVLDLACSDSHGDLGCVGHDKESVRTMGIWKGGTMTWDDLTLFSYTGDSPEQAARRAREAFTINMGSGHNRPSDATLFLTFGAQSSVYVSDYNLQLQVSRDFSSAHLKIKESRVLGRTLTDENMSCQKLPPNWKPSNWPRLLPEYRRPDGVVLKKGDVVLAPVKFQLDPWARRPLQPGTLVPGRIEAIYDNHRDPVRMVISGAHRHVPFANNTRAIEMLGKPSTTRGGGEAAAFRWTEPSEVKPLFGGAIEELYRAGALPTIETLDISTDVDCYSMGSGSRSGMSAIRFELGGGNLSESRMARGIVEKSLASKAYVSSWTSPNDRSADFRFLYKEVRVPGYQGRAWVAARERRGLAQPDLYWFCPAEGQ